MTGRECDENQDRASRESAIRALMSIRTSPRSRARHYLPAMTDNTQTDLVCEIARIAALFRDKLSGSATARIYVRIAPGLPRRRW